MKLHCPKCQHTFQNTLDCPDCGVRLVHQSAEPKPGESGGLAQFAGSDAFRWRDRVQDSESAENRRAKRVNLLFLLVALIALVAVARIAIVALR